VLDYEIELLKKEKVMDNLVMATIIMVNKIVDKALLEKIYEEVKHMLDILEIAMEDGVAKGRQEGRVEGEQNKAFQMARMLKHDGVNISTISRASGLSAEELTRL
jgi:predicted transposase/invertase (TIGR01784 family)